MDRSQLLKPYIFSLVLFVSLAIAISTPPGIAKNPSHARCNIKKYKHCYNLEHVCPKFCPDSCTVECASCKPICADGSSSPPGSSDSPPEEGNSSPPPPSNPQPIVPPPSPPTPTIPSPQTPSTPSNPPPHGDRGAGVGRARCRNKNFPQCFGVDFVCPSACPRGCEVDCVTCKPICKCDRPGSVCQDPRFIGGDGLTFYFHGKKDSDFCLLSDREVHINGHFIGKRNAVMTRDFTWVQSIAILFGSHQLYVGALKTATWDDSIDRISVSFDGQDVYLPQFDGATWTTSPGVTVKRINSDTNSIKVKIDGLLNITARVVPITAEDSRIHNYNVTEDDCLAHLDLSFKFDNLSENVDGVLGQTYRPGYVSRVKIGQSMPIMGGNKEFQTTGLFSTDCSVARFGDHGSGHSSGGSLSA